MRSPNNQDAAVPSNPTPPGPLDERYDLDRGEVQMTGLQALVRLPLDQRRLDRAAGLNTGIFISGYEGSPLAGFDIQLAKQAERFDGQRIVFTPSVNEELAASAVQGSQLASASAECIGDGVVGIWYGKAPGLDRATDAIRHSNLGGTHRRGGVLALVGDDSVAKSSTVPSSSESAIAELGMPCLAPADPQDVLDLGVHGIAMSRACGLWVAMKLATSVVDGADHVILDPARVEPVEPDRSFGTEIFDHTVTGQLLQPTLGRLESTQVRQRTELARRYCRVNGLNRVSGDQKATLGIVCAGAAYTEVRQALTDLGIDDLSSSGVRLLKLGVVHPLEPAIVDTFVHGLTEVLVVEEKKAFVELALKDLLYGRDNAPAIYGKRDETGDELFRADGDLPADYIAPRLASRIHDHIGTPSVLDWIKRRQSGSRARTLLPILPRTPYFCSGCPHNSSTAVPEGSLVGAGIGCHGMIALLPENRVGTTIGLAAMGGEGSAWTGMSPFVTYNHIFQNLGDGTFHHSGSLAIRAALASGTNITYKILYNDTVAMTGGQDAVGKMTVPQMVRELKAEGVARIVITSDAPKTSRRGFGLRLPTGVSVRHRDDLLEVQTELACIPGVTVLIHQQECATELRRKRKRGLIESPPQRIVINERVCEGCGDCGDKSNCLSVQPVDTEFGRKTRIHQASCNLDFSCIKGDCPSFVEVLPATRRRRWFSRTRPFPPDNSRADDPAAAHRNDGESNAPVLPAPPTLVGIEEFNMRITGVGGTGVVTVAQLLAAAATRSGLTVKGLDQLGLAQKGGAVVSDLRMSSSDIDGSNKIGPGTCDLYLGCDILVAAAESNTAVISPGRTYSVVSTSITPTGAMITDTRAAFPQLEDLRERIEGGGSRPENIFVDARHKVGSALGGDQYANVFLLGVAVQAGVLPIAPDALEWAVELNGVQVEANLEAFRRGRKFVVDEQDGTAGNGEPEPIGTKVEDPILTGVDLSHSPTLEQVVRRSVRELSAYQNGHYARRYVYAVEHLRGREHRTLGSCSITEEFARQLYKVMAYKDEYEVARLHIDPALDRQVREQFGSSARYSFLLHPPMLRAMGMNRKIRLDEAWARPMLRVLYSLRFVRGTPFDLFGLGKVRRAERALVTDYIQAVNTAAEMLVPATAEAVAALVSLPEWVRGYEDIKMRSLAGYYTEQDRILTRLTS